MCGGGGGGGGGDLVRVANEVGACYGTDRQRKK